MPSGTWYVYVSLSSERPASTATSAYSKSLPHRRQARAHEVKDPIGHLALGHPLDLLPRAIGEEDHARVVIAAETGVLARDVVGDDRLQALPELRQHLLGRLDRAHLDAVAGRMSGGRHQDDARAAISRRRGEGEAHLAARVVADEANRVDRLARAAGRDDDAASGQVVARTHSVRHRLHQPGGSCQAAGADMPARE